MTATSSAGQPHGVGDDHQPTVRASGRRRCHRSAGPAQGHVHGRRWHRPPRPGGARSRSGRRPGPRSPAATASSLLRAGSFSSVETAAAASAAGASVASGRPPAMLPGPPGCAVLAPAAVAACASAARCSASVRWAAALSACWRAVSAWRRAMPPAATATSNSAPGADEQAAETPVDRPLVLHRALRRASALLEELPLRRVEVGLVLGGPVERRRQAGAAVEVGGLTTALLPVADRAHQVEAQPSSRRVLLEPALEPRPLPEQGLVRDLDVPVAGGQQPRRDQRVEDARDLPGPGRRRARPAARAGGPRPRLAGSGEAQEDRARDPRLRRVELREGRLGEARDGALQPSARPIRTRA